MNALSIAAKFSNTCGYIDNLLTPKNSDFQACIGQIYPPELDLNKTTESHDSCSYTLFALFLFTQCLSCVLFKLDLIH